MFSVADVLLIQGEEAAALQKKVVAGVSQQLNGDADALAHFMSQTRGYGNGSVTIEVFYEYLEVGEGSRVVSDAIG